MLQEVKKITKLLGPKKKDRGTDPDVNMRWRFAQQIIRFWQESKEMIVETRNESSKQS